MSIITDRPHRVGRWLRPALAVACVLALTGCVVYPGGYYGAAPAYPAYAGYPGYYAAPPVGVVIGSDWGGGWGGGGGWRGGWGGGWHH
jgi:hypothetical protein